MTREQALEIAKMNHKAYHKADSDFIFGRGQVFDAFKEYGYRHGWFLVGGYSFCDEDITGAAYDITQAGWAFI